MVRWWGATMTMRKRLRTIAVGILVVVFAVSIAGYGVASWLENNFLNTDGYTELVAPLPRDPEVAKALASYTTAQIFAGIDVQSRIAESLPDRAQFLAVPLSQQLQSGVQTFSTNFIQGDRFSDIWIGANRLAQQRLVQRARTGATPQGTSVIDGDKTVLGINITPLLTGARDWLGTSVQPLISQKIEGNQQLANLRVDLHTSFRTFANFVKTIDALVVVLPALMLASLLGALALSRRRAKVLLIASLLAIGLSFLQLIGLRSLRPTIINSLADQPYRPMAEHIYQAFLNSFNVTTLVTLVLLGLVAFGAWLFGEASLAGRIRHRLGFYKIRQAYAPTLLQWGQKIAKFEHYILGALILAVLIMLAFVVQVSVSGALAWLLSLCAVVSLVHLVIQSSCNIKVENK